MTNLNINYLVGQLERFQKKEDKKLIQHEIANIFKELGYNAISEEIRNNRKAKSNALYGLKLYYKSAASDRYNIKGEIVYRHPQSYMDKLNAFKEGIENLINTFLTDGTDKQQEYIRLMEQYENNHYLMSEKLSYLNSEASDNLNREEWLKLHKEYEKQSILCKETKNELDQFVLKQLAG